MRNCVLKFLEIIDLFGTKITLKYKKDHLYKTPFGGFISLTLIIILALVLQNTVNGFNIKQFYKKSYQQQKFKQIVALLTKVNSNTQVIFNANPDILEVGNNNFMIAVKYDQNNFIERPMMNITFEKRLYQRFQNGTLIKYKYPMYLEPCTLKHFEKIPSYNINWTQEFQTQNLTDFLCLKLNEVFQIGGTFDNQFFYHIKYNLQQCVNSTNANNPWQPQCEDPKKVNLQDSNTRIKFIFTNVLINPQQIKNPIQSYMDSLILSVSPQKLVSQVNIFLNKQTVQTDNSLTPFQQLDHQEFPINSSGDFKESFQLGNFTKDAEIFFIRSNFSSIHKRSFIKMDQVISYIGGFSQICLLIVALFGKIIKLYFQNFATQEQQIQIVNYYNDCVYTIELANKLYDFDIKNDQFKKKKEIQENNFNETKQSLIQTETTTNKQLQLFNENKITNKQSQAEVDSKEASYSSKINVYEQNQLSKQQLNYENLKMTYEDSSPNKENQKGFVMRKQINSEIIKQNQQSQDKILFKPKVFSFDIRNSYQNKRIISSLEQNKTQELKSFCNQSPSIFRENYCFELQRLQHSPLSQESIKKQKSIGKIDFIKEYEHQNNTKLKSGSMKLNTEESTFLCSSNESKQGLINSFYHKQQLLKQNKIYHYTKSFLEQEMKKLISRNRSLSLKFQFFINKITFGKFFNNPQVKLLNKAIDSVKSDLDIFYVLDKLKELEKFKKIFLSEEQQSVFNFFPKPLIGISLEKNILSQSLLQQVENCEEQNKQKEQIKKYLRNRKIKLKYVKIVQKAIYKFKNNLRKNQYSSFQRLFNCYEQLLRSTDSEQIDQLIKILLQSLDENQQQNGNINKQKANLFIRVRYEEYI